MFDKMMNALLKKLLNSLWKAMGERLEEAARNEDNHDASSALYSVAHAFQSEDIDWEVDNVLPATSQREADLLHNLKEMVGLVEEFKQMPCQSLEQRLIAGLPRANAAIERAEQKELFDE